MTCSGKEKKLSEATMVEKSREKTIHGTPEFSYETMFCSTDHRRQQCFLCCGKKCTVKENEYHTPSK